MAKRILKKIAVAMLSAVGFTALSVGVSGCLPKSSNLTEPENLEITKFAPPADGSLPTAHTCAENLAYINYVFNNQTQYHSYSYGVTAASIATQTTRNFRDYKNGILMNTDLTYSSMVKGGTQTCSMYNASGEYDVYFRTSEAPAADTLPAQAVWSEDAPKFFDERAYHYTYGVTPDELFNYIVNEQNIIDSDQIKVNPDGTYTQNFTLDPKASTYYYQFGMKTRGGLSGYPVFESINFSVTFDGGWRILSSTVHEVSTINKGVVVSSVSDFSTEYWYDGENFDEEHFSFYENYFKKYLGDEDLEQGGSVDDKPIIDVTNVLSNGFSQIMNGGAQFEVAINLGANRYVGYAFVSLDLSNPLETLALKVGLGKSLKEQTLFIEYKDGELSAYYGKDFALQANLAEVKLAIGQFGDVIEKIKSAFATKAENAPAVQAEESDPLTDLMNQMVLTAGERQAVLTLNTDNLLGLGIGVDLKLVFGINDKEISFRSGYVGGLSLGGEEIDLGVTLSTTTAPEINREPSQTAANIADYIADIHSLLGADLIKVTANLNGDGEKVSIAALNGLNASVTAYADLSGVTVGAEADVSYNYKGKLLSAKANVWYGYDAADNDYGTAVVALTEFNGAPLELSVKCNIKEVADALGTLITFAGGDNGAGTSSLVSTLNGALSSDLSSLLTELYADNARIKAGISIDALLEMLNVNTGIKFGSCTLKYERGEGIYGGGLSAALPALGLDLSVCGESGKIVKPDTGNSLDLIYVIDDVKSLMNADLLKAHIALDGSAEGVVISQLGGVTADVDVYFDKNSVAVAADVEVGYTYNDDKVSAGLSAWYESGEGLGKIALSLNHINGAPVAAKVYCDISELKDAVVALLNYADIQITPFESADLNLDGIISDVLSADFAALLPVAQTGADGLNISLNADEALKLFGVNAGIDFGNVSLAYKHGEKDMLVAAVPALGLNVNIGGEEGNLKQMPAPADCLDLTQLVNTVQAVWEQVDGIIDNQSVSFEIVQGETFLSLDGIVVEIWGEGEVSWKKNAEYVALDLSMAITERATDVLTLAFIYDKNAENEPFIKLALNDVGIEIYKDDIEGVKSGFNDIYNKVKGLLGDSGEVEQSAEPENNGGGNSGKFVLNDNLLGVIFGVLASDNWVDALNDITVTTDGKSLALSYLSDNAASVEIDADGNLSLFYDGAFGDRFSLSGGLIASATVGNLCDAINSKLENYKMSSSKEGGSAGFVKLAYDYLFEALSAIDVSNILGSDTYTVTFKLSGDNTNIAELENVFIDAGVYVTGASGAQSKLSEADLNINAAGVVITLNVITERRGNNTYFYINLSQVAAIKLPDLKFKATQSSLYETFEVLFKTVNDTNVLDVIGKLLSSDETDEPAETTTPAQSGESKPVIGEALADKLANILTKLLNFNFNDAVAATETDGVMTATIDLDNIVKQLGIESGALGTVEAVINHNSHSMKTSGKTLKTDLNGNTELKEWISLSSELAARRDYSKLDRSEYISIEFLPALIDDLVKTATDDNGELHNSFTLSGNINANLVGMIDVNINPCTVTANIGENGFTVALVMHVNKAKVIGIGIPESTVGITYRDGLLTLAKGLNGSSPEYKVMTFDYFLDHMLTKNNSVLQWLFDISGWDLIMSFVKADVSSGLTSPEDISLFDASAQKEEKEISMYDFVKALRVIIGGNPTAVFGDYNSLEKDLGVYDNYYGFALNAEAVTNGVLTKLNAAITHSDAGLDRILASGAIQSYVTFSANLQFKEEWSDEYRIGTTLQGGVTAPDLYATALSEAAETGYTPAFDHFVQKPAQGYDEKFGCLTVSGGSCSEDYSRVLYSHTLTIINTNGESEERLVRHGSTIHLFDNNSPVYTDESKTVRLLYSVSPDEIGAASVIMNGDLTVYAVRREAVTVVVHNGSEEYAIASFIGDKVPTSVAGLETIVTPTYADGTAVGDNDIIDGSSNVIHIYGTFVNAETVVNYVKYTFSAQTMSYTASGKAAGFNDYYSTKGNTLVLENEIGGYPVTAIAANAFANTEGKTISKVIVPENIVTVGENAFLDNLGSFTLIFNAERVYFRGSKGNKNLPLYGCSTEDDGKYNDVTVYYNEIYCDEGSDIKYWGFYRRKDSCDFYITGSWKAIYGDYGGHAYSKGQWQFVDYAVNVDLNGVNGGTLTKEAVENILSGYFPYVSTGSYAGSAYEATVNKALENAIANFTVMRGGITYACVYTSEMSVNGGKATVTFNVSYRAAASIKVYSACAATYNGSEISAGSVTNVNATVTDGNIELAKPNSQAGYAFLGWAVEANGGLEFIERATGDDTVYYAIWGASKLGQQVNASVHTFGSTLVNPACGNGKWYDGNWNEVTSISLENTIVYTRARFTFKYTVSGSGTRLNDTLAGKSNAYELNYSNSFEVLEGQVVRAERGSDEHIMTITVDGNVKTVVTLLKFTFGNYTWKTATSEETVSTDINYTLKY